MSQIKHSNRIPSRPLVRSIPMAAILLALLSLLLANSAAAQPTKKDDDARKLGQIRRIELSFFGGWFGGVTYLSLPPIAALTTDLGASQILDYEGDLLAQPKYPGQIDAIEKSVDSGYFGGLSATFYLTEAFGLELIGAYGQSQAKITGQYQDPNGVDTENPFYDPSQGAGRFEWDRSDMTWVQGGANMVFVFGKRTLRPYLLLGLGGVLNSFPNSDSVGALYFQYGGGFRYELSDRLALKMGISSSLFSWNQDEVDLNRAVQYPMASIGLIWKHEVPEEVYKDDASKEESQTPQGTQSQDKDSGDQG
jgi:hypothetical protein